MFAPTTMERDNFNPYKFESSGESSDDSKDEKKKGKSAKGLAELLAKETEPKQPEKPKEEAKDDRSFLQKLMGEPVKETVKEEPAADKSDEKSEQGHESDENAPLEELTGTEQMEAAEAHIEARASELSEEAQGEQSPEEAAATQADEVFLEAVHNQLAEMGEQADIDQAVEAAFSEVTAEMGAEETDGADETDHTEVVHEAIEADQAAPQDFDPDQPVPVAPPVAQPPAPPVGFVGTSPIGGGAARSGSAAIKPARAGERATDRLTSADSAYFERRGAARGLLVGGVVGYLIGRRRGRIKTEKRLRTVQEKLEKQVREVQQKIEQKELVVRRLARERVIQTGRQLERASQPVRAAEAVTSRAAERPAQRQEAQQVAAANKAVDSLTKEELLAFSGQIKVGETSLRRVFEAKMVDEKGLRRLIKEYQAGHDLRRALAREFMVKELKFERDPTLRDLLPPEAQPRRQGGSNDNQGQSGQGASAAVNDIAAQIAAAGQSPSSIAAPAASANQAHAVKRNQTNVSSGVLVGLTLLTIGLAVYAIWLTISK